MADNFSNTVLSAQCFCHSASVNCLGELSASLVVVDLGSGPWFHRAEFENNHVVAV